MNLVLSLPELLRILDIDSREFRLAMDAAFEIVSAADDRERADPEWEARVMENYRAISERFLSDPDQLVRLVGCPCKAFSVFAPIVNLGFKLGPMAKANDFVVDHAQQCSDCQEALLGEIRYRESKNREASAPRPD